MRSRPFVAALALSACAVAAQIVLAAAPASAAVPALDVFGLTATGTGIVTLSTSAPGTLSPTKAITGLQGGEIILGIDVRPTTGQLFGLGSTSRVYVINATTGAATAA